MRTMTTVRRAWEWKPKREDKSAMRRGDKKYREAQRKGYEPLTAARRIEREQKRLERLSEGRQQSETTITRVGEADDLASVDSPARTSNARLKSRTGFTGEINWLNALEHETSASTDVYQ